MKAKSIRICCVNRRNRLEATRQKTFFLCCFERGSIIGNNRKLRASIFLNYLGLKLQLILLVKYVVSNNFKTGTTFLSSLVAQQLCFYTVNKNCCYRIRCIQWLLALKRCNKRLGTAAAKRLKLYHLRCLADLHVF